MKVGIVHCDYEEFQPDTYQGMVGKVATGYGGWQEVAKYCTEDPEEDLSACERDLSEMGFQVYRSSSVDNFFMDRRGYERLRVSS